MMSCSADSQKPAESLCPLLLLATLLMVVGIVVLLQRRFTHLSMGSISGTHAVAFGLLLCGISVWIFVKFLLAERSLPARWRTLALWITATGLAGTIVHWLSAWIEALSPPSGTPLRFILSATCIWCIYVLMRHRILKANTT